MKTTILFNCLNTLLLPPIPVKGKVIFIFMALTSIYNPDFIAHQDLYLQWPLVLKHPGLECHPFTAPSEFYDLMFPIYSHPSVQGTSFQHSRFNYWKIFSDKDTPIANSLPTFVFGIYI